METLKLIDHFAKLYPLSGEFRTAFENLLIEKRFRKGQVLHHAGQTPTIWFVRSGLVKGYYDDLDGKEHVTRFWKEGQIILLASDMRHKTAADRIMVLEDSYLTTISDSGLIHLYHTFREGSKLSSKILLNDRNLSELKSFLSSLPSVQGYEQFQEIFPAERILLKDIASYLEITPGRLSEIRRNWR